MTAVCAPFRRFRKQRPKNDVKDPLTFADQPQPAADRNDVAGATASVYPRLLT